MVFPVVAEQCKIRYKVPKSGTSYFCSKNIVFVIEMHVIILIKNSLKSNSSFVEVHWRGREFVYFFAELVTKIKTFV